MSSGRLNLSIRGQEDVPISGSPRYSYYLKNFARQESFEYLFTDNSIETIVQGRTPTYGDEIAFQVHRRGDFLSKVYLKIVLPPTYLYSNLLRNKTDSFNIYSIIEHVELIIGGQLIQRLTGEYILNYYNLYYSGNDLEFIKNSSELTIRDLKKSYATFGQFVLLPIPFYFTTRKGMELPLLSITKQNVVINIKLAPRPPIIGLPDLKDVTVATEYILLESETTKKTLTQNGLMYRVEQVQMTSTTFDKNQETVDIDLKFQNPVREIFVFIQPNTYQDINNAQYYNFFGNYRNSSLTLRNPEYGWYLSEHHIRGMSLRFNGECYINEKSSGSETMMSSVIPYKYYANADNNQQFKGYVYPFVINPLDSDSYGHINMSRILKKELKLFLNSSTFTRTARVYASSYNIMVIKDGLTALRFTNPSHYNPKIVVGDSTILPEGSPPNPNDMEELSPDQGYYYAIQITPGIDIVGIQMYTEETPQFGSDRDLHDDEFSYLFNVTDTFMTNADPTDITEYIPGSINQLLRTVIEVPNETNASNVNLYDIHTTDNWIYSSNYGFIKSLRLAVKVKEIATGSLTTVIKDDDNELIPADAEIYVYKSSKFFDQNDISGWIANSIELDTRNIAQGGASGSTYYYVGHSISEDNYANIHFARTFDFIFVKKCERTFDRRGSTWDRRRLFYTCKGFESHGERYYKGLCWKYPQTRSILCRR